jgi:hypothetical protein
MPTKKMTISQALRRRKQLKGAISTYTERVSEALVYRKERPPTFSFEDSTKALRDARTELIALEDAVAYCNALNSIEFKGRRVRLTWALRTLAELKGEISRYEGYEHRGLLNEHEVSEELEEAITDQIVTTTTPDGTQQRSYAKKKYTRITVSNITSRERAEKVEQLQREFDALNDLLETANHTVMIEYQDQPEEDNGHREAPPAP